MFLSVTFLVRLTAHASFAFGHRDEQKQMFLKPSVLPSSFFDCVKNTTKYDLVIVQPIQHIAVQVPEVKVDRSTVVFIVDMQNDFVFGSFRQPCESKRVNLSAEVRDLIMRSHGAGATIIASLAYHPYNHCSFAHEKDCTNEFHFGKHGYINAFPAHAVYNVDGENTAFNVSSGNPGYYGAAFSEPIRKALLGASNLSPTRVFEVFKGFSRDKESFSAFPYPSVSGIDGELEPFTGGFLLSEAIMGTGTSCFLKSEQDKHCLPTKIAIDNPDAHMIGVKRLMEVLKQENQVTQILVAGLFFDFAVKETAMAITKWDPNLNVLVVVEAARPALEGNYYESTSNHEKTQRDLRAAGVKLVSKSHLWFRR